MVKWFGCAALAALTAGASAQGALLKVGSMAPAITVAKWLKGQPVTKLGGGKVHVVEFWATWCPPCRESIPHLTELAKKYRGKATFSGVSVFEAHKGPADASYIPKVASFVKSMGATMDYNVAVDGPAGTMGAKWMEAAKQPGIPTAFVIGRDGRIAWIGHPMDDLDAVVAKVIAGNYDPKSEAQKAEKVKADAAAAEANRQKLLAPLAKLLQDGDMAGGAAEAKRLMDADPKLIPVLGIWRYNALLASDEPAAYAYGRELASTAFKMQPEMINQIAWAIVDDKAKLTAPDYKTAIDLAERAATLTQEKDANILDTLAYALWKKGDKARALAIQTKAVALAEKDPAIDADARKELRDRLAMMKRG